MLTVALANLVLAAVVGHLLLEQTAVAQERRGRGGRHEAPLPRPDPPPVEITVLRLGIKFVGTRDGLVTPANYPAFPLITAIQKDSPAYFAGLQPGDILLKIGTDSFYLSGYPRTPPFPMSNIEAYLNRYFPPEQTLSFDGSYRTDSGSRTEFRIHLMPQKPVAAEWITQRLTHQTTNFVARRQLPGVIESRASALQSYARLRDDTIRLISEDACSVARTIEALESELGVLAMRSGTWWVHKGIRSEDTVSARAYRKCDIVKHGVISDFEATLFAMVWREIDACTYSSDNVHTMSVIASIKERLSREEYGRHDLTGAVSVMEDKKRKACITRFMDSSVFGKQ